MEPEKSFGYREPGAAGMTGAPEMNAVHMTDCVPTRLAGRS